LEIALQFSHRFLRNNERIMHRVRDEPHFSKLSRPQSGVWIWKVHVVADRTCFWIEVSIQRVKLSFSRIDIATAENQIEVDALEESLPFLRIRVARKEIRERTFAHRYDGLDRVDLRHRRERSR